MSAATRADAAAAAAATAALPRLFDVSDDDVDAVQSLLLLIAAFHTALVRNRFAIYTDNSASENEDVGQQSTAHVYLSWSDDLHFDLFTQR